MKLGSVIMDDTHMTRTEFHVGSRRQKCRTARAKPRRGLSAKPNTKLSLFTDKYIIFKVCFNCLVTHLFIFVLLGIADLTGPLYGSCMEKCHTHLMMIHIINKYASKIILHASSFVKFETYYCWYSDFH